MADVAINLGGQVVSILREHFPGAEVDADRYYGAERVSGHIRWAGFEGMEPLLRQRFIFKALRESLGPEARGVSIILAYTPREWELMGEE